MTNEKISEPTFDNIKGLSQNFVEMLDQRMAELRVGSELDDVRPSDAKTFMLIARKPRTISEIARALGITRQSVHSSVDRLRKKGVITLEPAPDSNRDKIPTLTETGAQVRKISVKNLQTLESELETKIGKTRLEELRQSLKLLLE